MQKMRVILSLLLLCALLLSACSEVPEAPSDEPSGSEAPFAPTAHSEPQPPTKPTEEAIPSDPSEPAPPTVATDPTDPPGPSEEDLIRAQIAARTPLSPEEYSYKIACVPVLDSVGYAMQSNPSPYIHTSASNQPPDSEIYDEFYTDEQCPESYVSVISQYDEAFFKDHLLLCINIVTQNGVLPEIARLDIGKPYDNIGTVTVYIDNFVEYPTECQLYRIIIEMPRFTCHEGKAVFSAITRSSESYWCWETAQ